jgi:crotonobetainyl-CoA:carnitine CoA-transferase CaiB-like acyl-CoA transferase
MPLTDLTAVVEDLLDAPATSTNRSETAQLADLIEQIDAAMARGVSRRELHARLQKRGLTMSLPVFDNALHRIRKRMGRRAPNRTRAPISHPASPAPTSAPAAPVRQISSASHASAPSTSSPRAGIRTLDELAAENPHLSRMQLIKLEAQQYDQPSLSSAGLDEIARKYGGTPMR